MPFRLAFAAIFLASPLYAAQSVCVTNGTAETLLFAAEAGGGVRTVQMLASSDTLCSEGADGVVSVYESADGQEGCSRLVAAGGTETLVKYADFDRCRWSSHDN